ncbi:hypothetical protein ACYBSK_01565 [Streptomyces sp. BYX5S]
MRNRTVRGGVGAVAAVLAVLVVGGCGGDDGGGDEKDAAAGGSSASASASASAPASASPGEEASGDGASAGAGAGSVKDAQGIWSATSDGKPVVLVVGDKQAALTTGDGHLCTGTLTGADKPALTLKCADGNTDRTAGSVESNDGSTMRVSWKTGEQDTFKKTKGGELPTALPSGLPTT